MVKVPRSALNNRAGWVGFCPKPDASEIFVSL